MSQGDDRKTVHRVRSREYPEGMEAKLQKVCPNCNQEIIPDDHNKCPECGTELPPDGW